MKKEMPTDEGQDFSYTGYNPVLCPSARQLRKNMTRHENRLWYDCLKNCTPRWRRQRVIDRYIADFYCSAAKLVVELDGSQHYTAEGEEYDGVRTESLEQYGIEVLRFQNEEIDRQFDAVCRRIAEKVQERSGMEMIFSANIS